MSKQDIIRAWKDEEYRNSLSEAQRAELPDNPAGAIELPDDELENAAAAGTPAIVSAATAVTVAASCSPTCDNTALDGSCGGLSVGCCQ